MVTIDELQGYDWRKAFEYAGDQPDPDSDGYTCADGETNVSAALGSTCATDPVRRVDVKRIVAAVEGENDGPDWLIVVELKDGRFAFLRAGCDYTGWDCQASGHCIVDNDLAHLVRFGLGDEDRSRLGVDDGQL